MRCSFDVLLQEGDDGTRIYGLLIQKDGAPYKSHDYRFIIRSEDKWEHVASYEFTAPSDWKSNSGGDSGENTGGGGGDNFSATCHISVTVLLLCLYLSLRHL